ncbi:hypothetical protein [Actinophytocola xanthii]|uniref:Uncharacterized protein n=1 Tax=Actinophytocola xanthii TaxID=1912961 RepID=A0A1Q8CKB0_9PSEU|nr:hypothetical protein [Actinophytocola xanthii]OLF14795.1 hypothetical protein BU204_24830 [Actinophytocola xanthii]
MSVLRTGALVAAGVAAGIAAGRAVARRVGAKRQGGERRTLGDRTAENGAERPTEEPRWLVVTVNAPHDQVAEALPDLGPGVETRLTPAPGERGTELAARIPHADGGVASRLRGDDPHQELRRMLRDVKSRIETGEVIEPDAPTTGKPTPGGALPRFAPRRAGGEGRL